MTDAQFGMILIVILVTRAMHRATARGVLIGLAIILCGGVALETFGHLPSWWPL